MSSTGCTELLSRSVNDLSARRRYVATIMTSSAHGRHVIPRQLLAKIDHVLSLAHTHDLPTITPTQVLNHLDLAYHYGRLVPHTSALDEYDRAFKNYLKSSKERDEDRMKEELKKCEQCSEKAVEEAMSNCELVKKREQEENKLTLEELEEQRVKAMEVVEKERETVEQERDVYNSIANKIKKLKTDLHDAMYTFDDKLTTTMNELKSKRFTNLRRQEQLNEKTWHLENSVIEQRVEEAEVRERLTRNRLELKDLKDRCRTLSSLVDHEQHWLETVGKEYFHVFSELNTADQETHIEAAISILDTTEECIQLVTEDAVNKKRCGHKQRQEWSDVKLQYLLQLRHSIVTCLCIHMIRDEESSESHDQRMVELSEKLSVVNDQIHSLNPLIELDTVETVYSSIQHAIEASLAGGEASTDIHSIVYQNCQVAHSSDQGANSEPVLMENDRPTTEDQEESEYEEDSDDSIEMETDEEFSRTNKKSKFGESSTSHVRQCPHCPYFTKYSKIDLQRHIRTHTGEKPYSCEHCGHRFARSSHHYAHLRKVHSVSDEDISRLKASKRRQSRIIQKSKVTKNKTTKRKLFSCDKCGASFDRSAKLDIHMRKVHPPASDDDFELNLSKNKHQCPHCPYSAKKSQHLQYHIRTHTGEKPFACNVCKTSFSQPSSLTSHMLRKHGTSQA